MSDVKRTPWRVAEQTLSDGSIVYSVSNGEHSFDCEDEEKAYDLEDAIERLSVDDECLELTSVQTAAPELLEACKYAARAMRGDLPTVVELLDVAIAKAEVPAHFLDTEGGHE